MIIRALTQQDSEEQEDGKIDVRDTRDEFVLVHFDAISGYNRRPLCVQDVKTSSLALSREREARVAGE